MKNISILLLFVSTIFANDFFYENGKKVFVKKSQTRSINSIKTYKSKDGRIFRFKNEIIVQCKKNTTCLKDIKNLKVTNIYTISKNYYVIKLDKKQDIFKLSQKLYDLSSVKSAKPNLIKKRMNR